MRYFLLPVLILLISCSKYELTDVELEEEPAPVLVAYFGVGLIPQIKASLTFQRGESPVLLTISHIKLYRNDTLVVNDSTGSLAPYPDAVIRHGQNYRLELTTADGTQLAGNIRTAQPLIAVRLFRDTIDLDGSPYVRYSYLLDMNNPHTDQLPVFYSGGFIDSAFRLIDSSFYRRTFEGNYRNVKPDPIFNLNNNDMAFIHGDFKDTLTFLVPFSSFVGNHVENAVHFLSVMSPIVIEQYEVTKNIDLGLEAYYHLPVFSTNVEGGVGIVSEHTTYTLN